MVLAGGETPWGKRPIFSSTFYAALKHPNVELVPRAAESITPRGIVDADGVEREVDILVLAKGFQATNYLRQIEIVGRDGRTIHEYWDGEPRAFLGITVPSFPNLFILYGPGTNGGEIASNLRHQAQYARRAIKRMIRQGVTAVEVKRRWADAYHAWLQSKMKDTAWAVSENYFANASGKVVTQWPYSAVDYEVLVKVLGPWSETIRRRRAERLSLLPKPARRRSREVQLTKALESLMAAEQRKLTRFSRAEAWDVRAFEYPGCAVMGGSIDMEYAAADGTSGTIEAHFLSTWVHTPSGWRQASYGSTSRGAPPAFDTPH